MNIVLGCEKIRSTSIFRQLCMYLITGIFFFFFLASKQGRAMLAALITAPGSTVGV